MKKIRNIFYHELMDILKDEGIWIFIFFVPLFYPLLYSWVYTNEVVREVPAVVVDECGSQRSREFIRKVDSSPDVRIVARCRSVEEARSWVMQHEAYGIYHIPRDFDLDLLRCRQTVVALYSDMSSMLYYKALLLSATEVSLEMDKDIRIERVGAMTARDEEITRMPVEYEHVRLYNPSSGFASFLIPPVLMLILQQTLLLAIGMQMGRTRERNMGFIIPFNRLYKNPLTIVTGKMLVYLGIYIVMGIYAFALVTRWFSLPQLGHYLTFLAFLVPYLLACIFLAMTLSSLIFRREDCILIFVFLSVPLLFLSGFSWPASAMHPGWRVVSWLFPSTFGMNGYVRITTMGCSLSDIRTEWLALWAQAALYFTTACLMYRRHILKMVRTKER
jgi:ABC-2 type transport system permease protein